MEDKAGYIKTVSVLFKLTHPLHPNGKCCRSVIADEEPDRFVRLKDLASFRLNALKFRVKLHEEKTKAISFSMFLSSREATNDFHMDKFTIEGVELLASSRNLGYSIYDLQIYKHLYLGSFLTVKPGSRFIFWSIKQSIHFYLFLFCSNTPNLDQGHISDITLS